VLLGISDSEKNKARLCHNICGLLHNKTRETLQEHSTKFNAQSADKVMHPGRQ